MKGNKFTASIAPDRHAKYSKTATKNELWHNTKNNIKLTPSQFQKSFINMISDEDPKIIENLDLRCSTHETKSIVSTEEPIFQPSPRVIIFQDWKPLSIIEKKIFFRNNDTAARKFKVTLPNSPYFDISIPMNSNGDELKHSKIASGMEVMYTIIFKPTEIRDYSIELICTSEREKFLIPIRAVCMIPQVTLPDEIDFGKCQVKVLSRKTFQILNSSALPVQFTLHSSHTEITCGCKQVSIEPGAWYQLEVYFTPLTADKVMRGDIEIEFGPNQRCFISVSGIGQNSDIFLSEQSIILGSTYIGCTMQKSFRIHNASENPVDFEWKTFQNDDKDIEEKSQLQRELSLLEEKELSVLYNQAHSGKYGVILPLLDSQKSEEIALDPVQMNEPRPNIRFHEPEEMPEQAQIEETIIIQKYQNLHQALEKDSLSYMHSNFTISPLFGRIWSHSNLEVTVTFHPDIAMNYNSIAYCEVSGRQDRLPLQLSAVGLGPQLGLSFKTYRAGDVCVSYNERCDLRLRNKGEIPARWSLLPPTTALGHKFQFSSTDGVIQPGEMESLVITYSHDSEGSFDEEFRFLVQGSEELYTCSIQGHFVMPTMHFDSMAIKFGTVSCGCPHVARLRLVNTSPIPLDVKLYTEDDDSVINSFSNTLENTSISRIEHDTLSHNSSKLDLSEPSVYSAFNSFMDHSIPDSKIENDHILNSEFEIQPCTSILAPGDKKDIKIIFTPTSLKSYTYMLYVDVVGIGKKLLSLPITADCKKGELVVNVTDLYFGDCFINYPYKQELVLRNPASAYASLYEFVKSDQSAVMTSSQAHIAEGTSPSTFGVWNVFPEKAVVRSLQSVSATVEFTASRVGPFHVPMTLRVAGCSDLITATLHGMGRGPHIEASVSDLAFGSTTCLQPTNRNLTVLNSSPIPASVTLAMKVYPNNFKLSPSEIFMLPGESQVVELTATLDDACYYKDDIKISTAEGNEVTIVHASATGVGATLVCEDSLDPLYLGLHLTNSKFEKKVVFTNKCRRSQSVRWVNKTVADMNNTSENQTKSLDKDTIKNKNTLSSTTKKRQSMVVSTFTVSPSHCVIAPGARVSFTFSGYNKLPGVFQEEFIMEGTLGQDKDVKLLGQATVRCEVIRPLLLFSCDSLQFDYKWSGESDYSHTNNRIKTSQIVTLTNSSSLHLECMLKVDPPFSVDLSEASINTNQSVDVTIGFNPLYRGDKQTHSAEKLLQVSYRGHNQVNTLPLYGQIAFPNISFDCDTVNFGCLLNGTEKTISVTVTNSSSCPAEFEWFFSQYFGIDVEYALTAESYRSTTSGGISLLSSRGHVNALSSRVGISAQSSGLKKTHPISSLRPVDLSIDQVIDIIPARLNLLAGETATVNFHMTGLVEGCLHGSVVCAVNGGPEYTLPVTGEASNMTFQLSQSMIDFGCVDVLSCQEKELVIYNSGKVDFMYEVSLKSTESNDQVLGIACSADDRILAGGGKAKINLKLTPRKAGLGSETVIVRVAHFDPVEVVLYYDATVPSVYLDMPRYQGVGPRNEDDMDMMALQDIWKRFEILNTDAARQYKNTRTTRNLQLQFSDEKDLIRTSTDIPSFIPSVTQENIDSSHHASQQILSDNTHKKRNRRKSHSAINVSSIDIDLAMQRETFNNITNLTQPASLSSSIVIANYVCDFGTIVMGTAKKRVIRLVSLSPTIPLIWQLDSKLASTPDLTWNIKKGKLGVGEKTELVVKFQPTKDSYTLGPCVLSGTISLKGSVTICIFITANISIPEIRVSRYDIDFGSVLIGQCQQQKVKIFNSSSLSAVWKLKGLPSNDKRITITPDNGTLKAGKSQVLLVEYTPTDDCLLNPTVQLRVDGNSKPIAIRIKGKGLNTPIIIEPEIIDFGTQLPGRSVDRTVTVHNPNPFPIEVFCPEYDSSYHDEIMILNQGDFYNYQGVVYTKVRVPGESLDIKSNLSVANNLDSSSNTASTNNIVTVNKGSIQSTESLLSVESRVNSHFKPTLQTDASLRAKVTQIDIITVLPTMLPDALQWQQNLATKCGVPVYTPESLLNDVASTDSAIGKRIRQALKLQTKEELATEATRVQALQRAADDSQLEATKKYKKQNPKAKETPVDILQTTEWRTLETYKASSHDLTLTESLLLEALQFRFTWRDVQSGMMISIPSTVSDMHLQAIFNSLPSSRILVVDFKDGKDGYSDFIAYRYDDLQYDLQRLDQKIKRIRDTISNIKRLEQRGLTEMKSNQHSASVSTLEQRSTSSISEDNESIETVAKASSSNLNLISAVSTGYQPLGTESWFDTDKNSLLELDSHELKALSTTQQIDLYNNKLYYLCKENDVLIAKKCEFEHIWNVDADCLVEDMRKFDACATEVVSSQINAIAEGEHANECADAISTTTVNLPTVDTNTYEYYKSTLVPQVLSFSNQAVESAPLSSTKNTQAHEIITVLIESEDSTASVQANIQNYFSIVKSSSSLSSLQTISSIGESVNQDIKTFQLIHKPTKPPNDTKQFSSFTIISTTLPTSTTTNTVPDTVLPGKLRWTLPANSTLQLAMKFSPNVLGEYEETIKLMVTGSDYTTQLQCIGCSQYPTISADPRQVFLKRIKSVPVNSPPPSFRYVTTSNYYSFGAMHIFRKSPLAPATAVTKSAKKSSTNRPITPATPTTSEVPTLAWSECNGDSIRIHNSGKFTLRASINFICNESNANTFYSEYPFIDLVEGESKDIRIFAYPTSEREYTGQLEIKVSDSPNPVRFDVKCWGTKPRLEMTGPWEETLKHAEDTVTSCTDKKLLKDLESKLKDLKDRRPIDFGRVLASKKEVQTIQIKSESLLPIKWSIDQDNSNLSNSLQFSRTAGILQPGVSDTIELALQSSDPSILKGGFTFKYSDTDGGITSSDMNRETILKFKVTGEVYTVQAATVVGSGSYGKDEINSDIDFGLLKVGEVAMQTVKIFNKGQYDIGFRLEFNKRSSISKYITFEPSEGIVPAGKLPVEVKVSFCCIDKELLLQSNKDIRVLISDPSTYEIVDKFPLHISAICKYSRFRISPPRGLSFGTVRYESVAQQKTIEIRNEGQFEFRYIVCSSNTDFQTLDSDLQSFYLSAISSSLRSKEVGVDYVSKFCTVLDKKSTGRLGNEAVKTNTSKNNSNSNSSVAMSVAPYVSLNPLVVDFDCFNSVMLPTDLLKLGPFSVSNRVGCVLPGQAVSLDISFTADGAGEFNENLRVYISGTDPHDSAYDSIKAYSITGESCVPFISNDIHQAFEEQTIIEASDTTTTTVTGTTTHKSIDAVANVHYSIPTNTLSFGHVLCGDINARGVMERVKISNPSKVDCRVIFKLSDIIGSNTDTSSDSTSRKTESLKLDTKEKKSNKKGAKINNDEISSKTTATTATTTVALSTGHLGFTVHPEYWDIPAREHRYVNIYFNPTEIKTYRASFTASVDTSTHMSTTDTTRDPSSTVTHNLQFNIEGQGSFPNIILESVTVIQDDGSLLLDLGRVHVGRSSQNTIKLFNPSAFPAICLIDIQGDTDFIIPAHGTSICISPGCTVEETVSLNPTESTAVGERSGKVRITVLHNPFGSHIITLKGQVFSYDAFIDVNHRSIKSDGLNSDADVNSDIDDEKNVNSDCDNAIPNMNRVSTINILTANGVEHLIMPSIDLSNSLSLPVTQLIKLQSRTDVCTRFEFHIPDDIVNYIKLSPSIGHLLPFEYKEVAVTFSVGKVNNMDDEPVSLNRVQIMCELHRIIISNEHNEWDISTAECHPTDASDECWDNSKKVSRLATDADRELLQRNNLNADITNEAHYIKANSPQATLPLLETSDSDDEPQYVSEHVPEPTYELIVGGHTQKQMIPLLISAVSDKPSYTCDISSQTLNFAPTFMYQSMVHKFTVTNNCLLDLPITWSIEDFKNRSLLSKSLSSGDSLLHISRSNTINTLGIGGVSCKYMTTATIPLPFTVEPEISTIPAKTSQEFSIWFSPHEVDDYLYLLEGRLSTSFTATLSREGSCIDDGSLPDLNETKLRVYTTRKSLSDKNEYTKPIRAILCGTSKRPICHFEIKENREYLHHRNHNALKNEHGLHSTIECSNIRVVQVESIGVRTRNTFRFTIMNPTDTDYEYHWQSMGDINPSWKCIQTSGILYSGKQTHAIFEFLPVTSVISEAFFRFQIPKVQLEQVFLFAGVVKEPNVYFNTSKIDFQTVPLHGEGSYESIKIVNKENTPFNFAFDKPSLAQLLGDRSDKRPILEIMPSSGVVPSLGSLSITLKFRPQHEEHYNFNLVCDVKKKSNKLNLNVKGEGYAVRPLIQLESIINSSLMSAAALTDGTNDITNNWITLKPVPATNYCDFGTTQVFEKTLRHINISNTGKYNFDYYWEFTTTRPSVKMTQGNISDIIVHGSSQTHAITFSSDSEECIDGCMYTLTIAGHFKYNIMIRGKTMSPALKFSFTQFDFGSCYVSSDEGDLITEIKVLKLINRDYKNSISIECEYLKVRSLQVDIENNAIMIEPRREFEIPINFIPREAKDYAFVIPFLINGTTKVHVNITGTGIHPRIELIDLPGQRLHFGTVDVNSKQTKSFTLKNKVARSVQLQIEDIANTLASHDLIISPTATNTNITIPARGSIIFQVSFQPTKRYPSFSHDLFIKYAGTRKKLLAIVGKAQGSEARLKTEFLSFGTVILNSYITKKIKMENTGDLPLNYRWINSTLSPHINIHPMKGKILALSEITFDVQFRPTEVMSDLQASSIQVEVFGIGIFTVFCSGACVEPSDTDKQTLHFISPVRKSTTQSIKVSNPSMYDWSVTPSLDTCVDWSIPSTLQIPAKGSADLIVTYLPLTMTTDDSMHEGNLFIPLPDGTALSYQLIGSASEPECQETIQIQCVARKTEVFSLPIKNWLSTRQRLAITYTIIESPSIVTSVIVSNTVDLLPNEQKSIPVRLSCHCVGIIKGTIRLTNQESQEYIFFNFITNVTAANIIDKLIMETPVRICTRKLIYITNPLKSSDPVQMRVNKQGRWWSCSNKDVTVQEVKSLNGNTEGIFEVCYRPLIIQKSTDQSTDNTNHILTLNTIELGDFKYNLMLRASPSIQRGIVSFKTALGSSEMKKVSFQSFHDSKGEYSCKLSKSTADASFIVPKSISVTDLRPNKQSSTHASTDGASLEVSVSFCPTELGEIRDTLVISHPVWGEYVYDLIGMSTAPEPQGPIEFGNSDSTRVRDIHIRNCFPVTTAWQCKVDNPCFKLTNTSITLNGKASGSFTVTYDSTTMSAGLSSKPLPIGKLLVTCVEKPEIPPWVYYLKANDHDTDKNIK